MITKTDMAALLGRPLTPTEDSNFSLYLNIATQALDDLLCITVEPVTEERVFDTRKGYSTVFLDIFTEITVVEQNDEILDSDTYTVRQWNKRNAAWYNSIVLDSIQTDNGEITVTGDWGFTPSSGDDPDLPVDLQMLLAGLFGLISKKNKFDGTIDSKQVEDFRISFNADADIDEEFYKNFSSTIHKYSLCDIPNIQSGELEC